MRRAYFWIVLFAFILAACGQPTQAPSAATALTTVAPAATSPAKPTASVSSVAPAPSPLPEREPTRVAASTATTRAETPWPRYLRSLDLSLPAGNTYFPGALALHASAGRLYARTRGLGLDPLGWVAALSLSPGPVLAAAATGPDPYSAGDLAVDAVRDRLYIVNPGDKTASVLDVLSLQPIATLEAVEHLVLDAEGDRLYTAGPGRLRELDAAEYRTRREVALPPEEQAEALAADPAAGRIYLATWSSVGYALAVLDVATLAELSRVPLPGRPDALLPDSARGRVYLTANDGQTDWLLILDARGNRLEERKLGDWSRRTPLALESYGGQLALGRDVYGDNGIEILDLKSGETVADIALDHAPTYLLWDAARHHLWVSQTYQNAISVVDTDTYRLKASYPTAVGLRDVNIDPARGHVYVTTTADQLHVFDSDTDETLAVLPGEERIAVDGAHGRFYTGGANASTVRIFASDRLEQIGGVRFQGIPVADAHSGSLYVVNQGVYMADLATLEVTGAISDSLPESSGGFAGPAAVDAVVDAGSGRVFGIINNGVPGSNAGTYLYVYEPVTYEKVLTDTERSPSYIDIDPASGWAYVSRAHLAGRSTSVLVDGLRYTRRVESLHGALRVDPGLGRLFVSVQGDRQGQLFVLDAGTLDVAGSVPIPSGFVLRALDPVRHWLYLAAEDGRMQIWSATGGQMPAAEELRPADLAAVGPSRLFLPPGGASLFALDASQRLFRSDDGGVSWRRLGAGLPDEMVIDLVFSPDYEQDQTVFAAVATGNQGYGVWQSQDGGTSWRMTSSGLTDLGVFELVTSPDFGRDRTLFASAYRGGLYRSADGAHAWNALWDADARPDAVSGAPSQVLVSPTYGADQTLFVRANGLWRSEDGGDSWQAVAEVGGTGYADRQLLLVPDYAASRCVYFLYIPLEAGQRSLVWGSLDGGRTWSEVAPGPVPEHYGQGRIMTAPGGEVYLVWTPFDPFQPPQLFRSSSIAPLEGRPAALQWEVQVGTPLEAATPIELTGDGTALVALNMSGRLVRWPVDSLEWRSTRQPAAKSADQPTEEPCRLEPDRFRSVWEQARSKLGCPLQPAVQLNLAEQRFERGRMIWDSQTRDIYVLAEDGTWQALPDTWQEGQPEWDPTLPPPPRQPKRGFGKVWREQLGGPDAAMGGPSRRNEA